MKIAISSQGPELSSKMDSRFGRAPFFLIWDSSNSQLEVLDNKDLAEFSNGVGIKAAQKVVDAGAELVISGHLGPKAGQIIEAAGIPSLIKTGITVQEAIDAQLNA